MLFHGIYFGFLSISGHTVLFPLKALWDSLSLSAWPSLDSCSFPISRATGLTWPRFLPQCHFCSFCVLDRTQGDTSSSGIQFSVSVKIIEASIYLVLTRSQQLFLAPLYSWEIEAWRGEVIYLFKLILLEIKKSALEPWVLDSRACIFSTILFLSLLPKLENVKWFPWHHVEGHCRTHVSRLRWALLLLFMSHFTDTSWLVWRSTFLSAVSVHTLPQVTR